VAGTVATPTGITDPPIDQLLERAESKYALVLFAAKRARQINAYYSQLNEGLLEYVGPLVESRPQEKSLSIAMREIDAGLLTNEPSDPTAEPKGGAPAVAVVDAPPVALDDIPMDVSLDTIALGGDTLALGDLPDIQIDDSLELGGPVEPADEPADD
jgi:DNA-directed RNA polymerase subunit omega